MAKHAIGTFSYPLKDAEIIEEAERLAKEDGKSFSQLILRLLKQEINQKKVRGSPNPLNISYNKEEEKPLQLELDRWIQHVSMLDNHNQLSTLKGRMLAITKQIDRRSMELYRSGIKQ